jgi:FlaA1/EpsC-like NDP-sugar epimerase
MLPPGLVINIGMMAFLGFVAVRYRERLVTGLASRWVSYRDRSGNMAFGERVLIVGAGECGQLAAWLLLKSKFTTPYNIIGMVDDDPRKQGQTIDNYPVLGQTHDIPLLVKNRDIGLILFSINKLSDPDREKILAVCKSTAAHLVIVPDILNYFQKQLARQK